MDHEPNPFIQEIKPEADGSKSEILPKPPAPETVPEKVIEQYGFKYSKVEYRATILHHPEVGFRIVLEKRKGDKWVLSHSRLRFGLLGYAIAKHTTEYPDKTVNKEGVDVVDWENGESTAMDVVAKFS